MGRTSWAGPRLVTLITIGVLSALPVASVPASPVAAAKTPVAHATTRAAREGTAAASAADGAIPPSHPNRPARGNAASSHSRVLYDYSLNWSGIADTGTTFTGVSGDWQVPAVSPSTEATYSATWLGIDGFSNQDLIQTGTEQDSVNGGTQYSAWYELLPAYPVTIPDPVAPGDEIDAAIALLSTDQWQISLDDTTAGWQFSVDVAYTTPEASAEWIEESPGLTLADFGATTFTGVGVTGADLSDVVQTPVQLVDESFDPISYPGPFDQATGSFTISYGSPPNGEPTITSVALPPAAIGAPYSATPAETGGTAPLVWSVASGTLPPGLALDPATGTISGTPTATGTFQLALQVTDVNGGVGDQTLPITVLATEPPLGLAEATFVPSYDYAGELIPFSYVVTNDSPGDLTSVGVTSQLVPTVSCPTTTLPAGAGETCTGTYTVTSSDLAAGSITDTATASAVSSGAIAVSSNPATAVVYEVGCLTPLVVSPSSATAMAGSPFNFTVVVCAAEPVTISTTGLPAPLRLKDHLLQDTATISGTPTGSTAGPHSVAITVDGLFFGDQATQTLMLQIDSLPRLKAVSAATATVGTPFRLPIRISHSYPLPTITTASTLPPGVELTDHPDGSATLRGSAEAGTGGVYPVVLEASNGLGTPTSADVTLTVEQAPAFTSVATDTVAAGSPMTPFTVTATGFPSPRLHATGVPSGVTFTDNGDGTGTLTGTPTATGAYDVGIRAANAVATVTQTLVLVVKHHA